jgi:hypothetical protein
VGDRRLLASRQRRCRAVTDRHRNWLGVADCSTTLCHLAIPVGDKDIIDSAKFVNMTTTSTTTQNLRRVFYDSFVARDLAEPLASFDASADTEQVKQFMLGRPLTVIGIRQHGIVSGIIQQDQLNDLAISKQSVDVSSAAIVSTTSPFRDVVAALNEKPFVLVETLGQPVGVIVRADLEKPPMRMWLFGMVTLFEMSITRVLSVHYPNDSWTEKLSGSRVAKARDLQVERLRRNEDVQLIDCLQLSDKGKLFVKSDELRSQYWNRSKTTILTAFKDIESLRNNLAHSQSFIGQNWDVMVRLTDTLDSLLDIPSELISPSSLQHMDEVNEA